LGIRARWPWSALFSLKSELEVRRLGGEQTLEFEPTQMEWRAPQILAGQLEQVEGDEASPMVARGLERPPWSESESCPKQGEVRSETTTSSRLG
jgi:hypothetical protein